MYRMSVKYDNWNEWYLNEKNKNGKEYIYGTIHPAGYNKDEKEWLTSGKTASENTINEISFKINSLETFTKIKVGLCGLGITECEVSSDDTADIAIVFKDSVSKDDGFSIFNNYNVLLFCANYIIGLYIIHHSC